MYVLLDVGEKTQIGDEVYLGYWKPIKEFGSVATENGSPVRRKVTDCSYCDSHVKGV